MKITVESTSKIVDLNGIPTRVWEGKTANGVAVHAFIAKVAVNIGDNAEEFDRDLIQTRAPSPEVAAYPARLII